MLKHICNRYLEYQKLVAAYINIKFGSGKGLNPGRNLKFAQ